MGRKKQKSRKWEKNKSSNTDHALHPEAESTFKIIQTHPAVNGKVLPPRPLDNGTFEIQFQMDVNMPTRVAKGGMTWTGVKAQEPVIFRFPATYPFSAPAILLRPDFNRDLPHINPLMRSYGEDYVLPCIYDGPIDDLLHESGDGLSDILNQLSTWLGKAAVDDLIDPAQGWEPIRRDDSFGWIVYDLDGLRACVRDQAGALVFQCRFRGFENSSGRLYFAGGIDHQHPRSITPLLIDNTFLTDNDRLDPLHGSLIILAWPESDRIADQYLPESVNNLTDLYRRASDYGCDNALKSIFIEFGWAIKRASTKEPIFPVAIVLCARRPVALINDDASLELIPYMVYCHFEDGPFASYNTAARIKENSPAYPLGHRHVLTGKLLRQMSGSAKTLKTGTIVHIGCGSVGSKIALHLARSGHGPFKLIDKSAFSPHNVARHALIPLPEVPGLPKATFLSEQIKLLSAHAEPYDRDFTDLCQKPDDLKQIFPADAQLVIESTGSAAVRELLANLSPRKLKARVLHAGLFHGGQIGLLALEGKNRNPDISDLTVQFHDLRVDNHHIALKFQDSAEAFSRQDVGLGCGSHTMVMPDTRLSMHAAGMAERARQVLEGKADDKGEIWIGMIDANGIQVNWKRFELGETTIVSAKGVNTWEIRILKKTLDHIQKEAEICGEIETGGVLIGRISLSRRCISISRVLDAPPDSKRSINSFVLGTQGLIEKVTEICSKTNGYLNYVGTWHSHPKGENASEVDRDCLERMKKVRLGAPAVGLIWTPNGFNAIIDEGKLS